MLVDMMMARGGGTTAMARRRQAQKWTTARFADGATTTDGHIRLWTLLSGGIAASGVILCPCELYTCYILAIDVTAKPNK